MEIRELEIRNRNGKRMPATLRVPVGDVRGTVVLLHGLAGWKDQSTVVAIAGGVARAGYQVITFDGADALRGPDASYWNSTTTGFIEDMEDVIAFVESQDWYQAPLVLAGHSLGAMCVVRYARMHPKEVTKLLLVAPGISWTTDRSGKFLKKIRFTAKVVSILSKRQKENGEKFLMPLYPPWIFDFLKYDTRKDAPSVAVPVLVVSAGDDLVVAAPTVHEALTGLFPQATHVIIPHASHIFLEHERELADTITQWLTSS